MQDICTNNLQNLRCPEYPQRSSLSLTEKPLLSVLDGKIESCGTKGRGLRLGRMRKERSDVEKRNAAPGQIETVCCCPLAQTNANAHEFALPLASLVGGKRNSLAIFGPKIFTPRG